MRLLLDWVPALLSVVAIFLESTATMSANNTSRWLLPLWLHLFGPITPQRWGEVHHLIRKTGHFIGYGLVSLTFFYSWRQTFQNMAVRHWSLWRRSSLAAVLCTLIVASMDEYHQSFLPSRTSSPIDVCIDVSGAVAAQLFLLFAVNFFARRPAFRQA